jgi:ketosteroid isomerase-like protein
MLKTVLIAALLAGPAFAAEPPATPSPVQIEKAERAFAADGLALGVRDSFLKHMADDAIVFRPGPVNAKALYEKRPSSKTLKLEWWPQKVVIARSGDLGLSVGPSAVNGKRGGYYATIWRKGPDGQWKWIYDGGAEADAASAPDASAPAIQGPTATRGSKSPADALAAVRAAEAKLTKAAIEDAPKAYRAALASDVWLTGPSGTEDLKPSDLAGRIARRPPRMAIGMDGGGASAAGDFVWTHGTAAWPSPSDAPINTHYMHVWQKRPEGWRLIFETLNTDP